ncbi:ABC transporter ATP-binding protein [Streptomyces sp. NPDC056149]|uniref:ABC transporter ATP-binding protein n=1 Tax=Streptomyces sp. NPDC056149 TaxID=3345728 RepID=UPI0035DF66BE
MKAQVDCQADRMAGGWIRKLLRYCRRHPLALAVVVAATTAGTAATAAVPLIIRSVVDDVVGHHHRPLGPLLGAMAAVTSVGFLASYARRRAAGRLSLEVLHALRSDMFHALVHHDGRTQDRMGKGQLISRMTSDAATVQRLLDNLPTMLGSTLLFVFALTAMLVLSPTLTLVAAATGLALWWVARCAFVRVSAAAWHAQEQTGAVTGVVSGAVDGVRVVKSFGQEDQEQAKLRTAARDLFASRVRSVRLRSRYGPLMGMLSALGQVGILALGGWLTLSGHISLGTFLAFSAYLAQLMEPTMVLSSLVTEAQQTKAGAQRMFEIIDSGPRTTRHTPHHPQDLPDREPRPAGFPPVPAAVELDRVAFRYDADPPLLAGVSLTIRPGETVALVGPAGSGKSTLAMLLTGFYPPADGTIRIDGQDIGQLPLESLRSKVAIALQDSFLFHDTIRANLTYGNPGATPDQITAAARAAQAHTFIEALPQGYDTVIGERGQTLSGGQRQRLALARALLSDADVLVIDDLAGAVDARTSAAIHRGLRTALRDRTALVIAYRESTLALADRVALLDGGRILATGTHSALKKNCPPYRALVAAADPRADPPRRTAPHPVTGVNSALWDRHQGQDQDANGKPDTEPPPELATEAAKLSAATDTPNIDEQAARRVPPGFRLPHLLRPLTGPLILSLALVIASAAGILTLPALVRTGIDQGISGSDPAALLAASLAGLGVVLFTWGINVAKDRVSGRTSERLLYTLRLKAFGHLQRIDLEYYAREGSGRIITRLTADMEKLSAFLQTNLTNSLFSLLSLVTVAVLLLIINVPLALAVLALQPALIVATLLYRRVSSRAYLTSRERAGALVADLEENIAGLRTVQAYRHERRSQRHFDLRSRDFTAAQYRAQCQLAAYFSFVQLLADTSVLLVLALGASWVTGGSVSAGVLAAFLLYIELFFSPVQELSQSFDSYQQAAAGFERVSQLLRTPPPESVPAARRLALPPRLDGPIALDGVRFAYPATTREALSGIDVVIPPDRTTALVGRTGAGKSTVVQLLSGLYAPTAGAIRIGGADLREFDPTAYRRRLGIVPQEAYLFAGTARDNIAYGRPDAADIEVERAARAVGAHDMIASLAHGYHHQVGEGGRGLSAGQRQLLALARAQLVDPDILIMDEATAALDPVNEAAVHRSRRLLSRHRTTIVVTHQMHTAAAADFVVVLDGGRVAQTGTHDELLSGDGPYAELWSAFIASSPPEQEGRPH